MFLGFAGFVMLSRLMFTFVNFAARNGLAETAPNGDPAATGHRARRTGVRGETYAYWYLRRHGYIFVARNYTVHGIKGEVDLVGYDGPVLAFIEVKTRTLAADGKDLLVPAEGAVTFEKRRNLSRMARHFLTERRIREAQCRFDVLALECRAGCRPAVKLLKNAFTADT